MADSLVGNGEYCLGIQRWLLSAKAVEWAAICLVGSHVEAGLSVVGVESSTPATSASLLLHTCKLLQVDISGGPWCTKDRTRNFELAFSLATVT